LQNRFSVGREKDNDTLYTRYSVFNISDRLFGIEILYVKEVLKNPIITKLPNVEPQIVGVFNLRGTILPLIDLRMILGLDASDKKDSDMVLLLENSNTVLGVLVEKVLDFVVIEDIKIQLPSRDINPRIANSISGFFEKEGTGVIYLIDPERFFDPKILFQI
jgi:purine-binding chemotaxis protein CheW